MKKFTAIIVIMTAAASFASCSTKSEDDTKIGKATAAMPSRTTTQTASETTEVPAESSAGGESQTEFPLQPLYLRKRKIR